MIKYNILKTADEVEKNALDKDFSCTVVKGVDLRNSNVDWHQVNVRGTLFIGCQLKSLADELVLREGGARVFPPITGLPYDPFRSTLYTADELIAGYDENESNNHSLDFRIERHFLEHG